ncbi:MAG: hypothetical protein JST96_10285 [Bacteroidetes bacterium]|nr:hypothetical protein [Bacteroidota bacterium]
MQNILTSSPYPILKCGSWEQASRQWLLEDKHFLGDFGYGKRKKKSPKEASNIFHNIMKASVANNPKTKPVKPSKKKSN